MTDTIPNLETLTFEVNDNVGLITLNRPESKNALDLPMRADLTEVILHVRENQNISALIITGSGGAFCAGGDLKSLSEERRPIAVNRKRVQDLHLWFRELVDLELPVIAAVDGPAFGAGFNLALAADFIFASPRARFCAVFGRIGLVPDLGGFFLLPRIVGLQAAKDIVFTARTVAPEEAKSLGLIRDIVPENNLLPHAIAFAKQFANASRPAIGMAKTILNKSTELDQRALSEMESYAQAVCLDTDYHHEAVARFLAKEPLMFNWDKEKIK
ncbi:enoyl-CoA hydratase/isomerase family protein [Sneathiella sp.]|uniref:enoyl-CoA hydratase/isomerase family protein n=1 Tax=Sneathiella sp. TaxID=1964365 RepID=UPI0026321CED|nr:enoyl-CoA hydratase/isomerase family protein [Sneathiella sp.]MDF2368521.1 enoyl-CoA hydratase/isomerase family protein [Sneathiella sp.]